MSTVIKFPPTRHPNLRHLLWRQVFAELHHLRTRSLALYNLLRGFPFLAPEYPCQCVMEQTAFYRRAPAAGRSQTSPDNASQARPSSTSVPASPFMG